MRRGSSFLPMAPLRLGISACLLGHEVRYDGGHKRDPFLAETLGRFVEWVPVCPEVELGLGVPREPIRLEGDPAAPRLVAANSRRDLTRAMTRAAWARWSRTPASGRRAPSSPPTAPASWRRSARRLRLPGGAHRRRRPLGDRPEGDQRRHDERLGGREARLEDDEASEAVLRHAE